MKVLRIIIVFFTLNLLRIPVQSRIVISIKNQVNFDSLSNDLRIALQKSDRDIYVQFVPGHYFFSEKHIDLSNIKAANKRVHINGNGAVIIPSGRSYKDGDTYEGIFSFRNSWMSDEQDVDVWSKARFADGLIEVINAKTKECRLKSSEPLMPKQEIANAYILVTQWYLSHIYKINKIQDNYIYFTADNLAPKANVAGAYNVNNDYYYMKVNPRYKLCNVETEDNVVRVVEGKVVLPKGVKYVREGLSDRLLLISDCSLNSLEIKGIKVMGNSNAKEAPALDFVNSTFGRAYIHDCTFVGIRSNLMNISSSNVIVDNNVFSDCYLYGIQAGNKSNHTIIRSNEFANMGKGMNYSFCVSCSGEAFDVSDNTFTDFGYGAISCGVWYGSKKEYACSGVVECNNICNSDEYLSNMQNYTLMDGGAIYLATKMDGLIIRNNRINGITGAGDNRGIFCDDGARNFIIENNVITNIHNSYCIDSRRVARMEPQIGPTNVNNVIRNNILDGKIRFVGREGTTDNGCEYGTNYYLVNNNGEMPLRTVTNATALGDDVSLTYTGKKKGRIGLDSKSYKRLKKSPVWKQVRKLFIKN